MSKTFFFFLLIIILNLLQIIFSQNENEEEKNFNYKKSKNKRYSNTNSTDSEGSGNPYLILRLPPWSKFEDVEKRYIKLRDRAEAHNTLRSKNFKLVTYAYEKIKKEYEKNNYKDKSFFGVLIQTFKNIFIYEVIMLGFLLVTWFIYKFNTYAAWLVVTFVAIDNLIPHWFNTMFTQYIISFILGTIIYFRQYFYPFICGNKSNKENNNSGIGQRKRRRFEKIE